MYSLYEVLNLKDYNETRELVASSNSLKRLVVIEIRCKNRILR